jgi:hypothetical protein
MTTMTRRERFEALRRFRQIDAMVRERPLARPPLVAPPLHVLAKRRTSRPPVRRPS